MHSLSKSTCHLLRPCLRSWPRASSSKSSTATPGTETVLSLTSVVHNLYYISYITYLHVDYWTIAYASLYFYVSSICMCSYIIVLFSLDTKYTFLQSKLPVILRMCQRHIHNPLDKLDVTPVTSHFKYILEIFNPFFSSTSKCEPLLKNLGFSFIPTQVSKDKAQYSQ